MEPQKNQRSEDFEDESYYYRIVKLGEKAIHRLRKQKWEKKLLNEKQWRSLAIEQGNDWEHYSIFDNEPHVMLFRKVKN